MEDVLGESQQREKEHEMSGEELCVGHCAKPFPYGIRFNSHNNVKWYVYG